MLATTTLLTGGIGTYLATMASGFKSRGWVVHCVVTHSKGDLFEQFNDAYKCHCLADQPLSLGKVVAAARLTNEISPDLILLNHCSFFHYVLPFLETKTKVVSVLHSEDVKFYTTAALFGSRIFRWVAPSDGVAKGFASQLSDSLLDRVRTISHGVDTSLFFPHTGPQAIPAARIIFVGYVAENKGAELLPAIMSKVVAKRPDAHLVIVGYGPLLDKLRDEFCHRSLLNHVTFAGVLSAPQVAESLRHMDIGLIPTKIEGFGLSVVEAMMSAVVPVVSRLEGVTDTIVSHNETGMLVEVDDVEGFSTALVELLSDPERLTSMKHAAQKAAREKFSLRRMIDDYERMFDEEGDRPILPRRSIFGWLLEVLREMTRKKPDGTFLFQQKMGTIIKFLTPNR